jgi:hypothetical protein
LLLIAAQQPGDRVNLMGFARVQVLSRLSELPRELEGSRGVTLTGLLAHRKLQPTSNSSYALKVLLTDDSLANSLPSRAGGGANAAQCITVLWVDDASRYDMFKSGQYLGQALLIFNVRHC